MKWATPTWPAVSSREPASTYAATDTDRAAGSRALITRGPAGSAVRSNIRSMVADNGEAPAETARASTDTGTGQEAGVAINVLSQACRK
jgi:hypothetical protein